MKRNFLFLLSLILITASVVKAQQDTASFLTLEQMMNIEVVTASKSAQKLTDAPATMYVVTREQIKARGYSGLNEVLADIPEIEVIWGTSSSSFDNITLRGMSGNSKFVIMVDGIRLGSPTGSKQKVSSNYPVAMAQRIEIIMGPASALYGADAYSGIINIITVTGNDFNSVDAKASYGMFNNTDNMMVAGFGNDEASFQISASYFSAQSANLPEIYPENFQWFNNNYKVDGSMDLFGSNVTVPIKEFSMPLTDWYVGAKANFSDFTVGFSKNYAMSSSSAGTLDNTTMFWDDAIIESSMENFYVNHQYNATSEKFSVNSTASYSAFEWLPNSKFINHYSSYANAYKYDFNSSAKFENQIQYLFSDKQSIIAGVSYDFQNILPKTGDLYKKYDKSIPAALQNLYWPGSNVSDINGNDLTMNQDFLYMNFYNVGAYAQYMLNINDMVKFTLGSRFDYNSRYGNSINPRAGVVITPSEKFTVKLLYGKAYLAPSGTAQYEQYGSFYPTTNGLGEITGLQSSFLHLANPDLKPAVNNAFELSMLFFLSENLTLSANGFLNLQSDLLADGGEPNGTYNGFPVDWIERSINASESEAFGGTFKADIIVPIGSGQLQTSVAYSYVDGDIDDQPLLYTAKNTVKALIGFQAGNLNVSLNAMYRTESHTYGSTNDVPLTNDPFYLVNAYASYKLPFKIKVFVKASNLLNTKYTLPADYTNNWPGQPLTVSGGLYFELAD